MKLQQRVFYKAIVYSEPTMMGAIKVRLPEVHGIPYASKSFTPDSELPYAYPAIQYRTEDWGQNIAPLMGTQVYVAYFDESNIIYFGNAINSTGYSQQVAIRDVFLGNSTTVTQPHTVVNPPYKTTIFKSFKGATIEVSDQDTNEYIKLIGPQGGHVTIGNRTLISQRRGENESTIRKKELSDGSVVDLPLDSYIDIDDGKGNKILIDKDGVTINCKKFKLIADETEGI